MSKDMHFQLQCQCGQKLAGFFSETDKSDKLHCDCGLVWEIKRPYQESEQKAKTVNVEMPVESYQNIHLLLHNLTQLTASLSNGNPYSPEKYQEILGTLNKSLKNIKEALEVRD